MGYVILIPRPTKEVIAPDPRCERGPQSYETVNSLMILNFLMTLSLCPFVHFREPVDSRMKLPAFVIVFIATSYDRLCLKSE